MGFLEDWDLSYDEINELLTANPSLRSFVSGYAAELKCRIKYFEADGRISGLIKYDDHDRLKKGDISFIYRQRRFNVEVKSLQTNSIKQPSLRQALDLSVGTDLIANFQCDASDKRTVKFSDESEVETTALLVGEFDVLAVNLHGVYGDWEFAFAKNYDLPRIRARGKAARFSQFQRDSLLSTSMPMTFPRWPKIYTPDPYEVLDALIEDDERGVAIRSDVVAIESSDGSEVEAI